jgi:hypothetical protein
MCEAALTYNYSLTNRIRDDHSSFQPEQTAHQSHIRRDCSGWGQPIWGYCIRLQDWKHSWCTTGSTDQRPNFGISLRCLRLMLHLQDLCSKLSHSGTPFPCSLVFSCPEYREVAIRSRTAHGGCSIRVWSRHSLHLSHNRQDAVRQPPMAKLGSKRCLICDW